MINLKINKFNRQQVIVGILFIMPWFIGFIVFGLYPMIMSAYYSLCRYDVLRIPQFIGFGNYEKLIFEDDSRVLSNLSWFLEFRCRF